MENQEAVLQKKLSFLRYMPARFFPADPGRRSGGFPSGRAESKGETGCGDQEDAFAGYTIPGDRKEDRALL